MGPASNKYTHTLNKQSRGAMRSRPLRRRCIAQWLVHARTSKLVVLQLKADKLVELADFSGDAYTQVSVVVL